MLNHEIDRRTLLARSAAGAGAVLVPSLLAACGGGGDAGSSSSSTVQFETGAGPRLGDTNKAIVKRFEAANSKIHVKVNTLPIEAYFGKILQQVAVKDRSID